MIRRSTGKSRKRARVRITDEFSEIKKKLYSEKTLELDYKSCEMMADDLYDKITDKYPGREVHIDVSEDGENGAHIEYPS